MRCLILLSLVLGCAGESQVGDDGAVTDDGGALIDARIDAVQDAPVPLEYRTGDPCQSGGGVVYANANASTCTMQDQSLTRTYELFVPASYRGGGSIVVQLHGHPNSGPAMMALTGMNALAATEGFIVVYPTGTGPDAAHLTWNIANMAGRPDDTAFLRAMIADLQDKLYFSPRRVYVAGFSGGAIMAHKAGREMSDVIAAIGSACGLAGLYPGDPPPDPTPEPVSVIMYGGTNDSTAPFCASHAVTSDQPFPDFSTTFWTTFDGCATVTPDLPFCNGTTPTAVTQKIGSACTGGAAVEYYKLQGGTHTYYANLTAALNPAFGAGTTTNDLFWRFFRAHPKP